MEKVILFLLSQIVFGILERPLEEDMYFSPHSMSECGKVFWQEGEAVGFYTMKKKGVNYVLNKLQSYPQCFIMDCMCIND